MSRVQPSHHDDSLLDHYTALCDKPAEKRRAYIDAIMQRDASLGRMLGELAAADDEQEIDPLVRFDLSESALLRTPLLGSEEVVITPRGRARIEALVSPQRRVGDTEVYRARLLDGEGLVALKLLVGNPWDPERRRRFRLEAWLQQVCEHPGIARLRSAGVCEVDGHEYPALVAEFIEGDTLDLWARSVPTVQAVRTLAQAARAAHFANIRGVVHRDLKPANIMVGADGTPTILDFGVASMIDHLASDTASSLASERLAIVGTPAYMAPEQFVPVSGRVDLRADVYAFGCMLRELIAPQPAEAFGHAGEPVSTAEIYQSKLLAPAPPATVAGVPRELALVASIACAPDRENRHESCAEFADEVTRALDARPLRRRPPGTLGRALLFARRRPGLAALLVVAIGAISVSLGIYITGQAQVAQQRDRAESRFDTAYGFANWVLFDLESEMLGLRNSLPVRRALIERSGEALDGLLVDPGADEDLRISVATARTRLGELLSNDLGDYQRGAAQQRAAIELLTGIQDSRAKATRLWARFSLAYTAPFEGIDYAGETAAVYSGLLRLEPELANDPHYWGWRSRVGCYQSRRRLDAGASLEELRGILALAIADANLAAEMDPGNIRAARAVVEAAFWRAHLEMDFAGAHNTGDANAATAQAIAAALGLEAVNDPQATEQLARATMIQARVHRIAGRYPQAIASGSAAVALSERAVREHPNRKQPFRVWEVSCAWLAETCLLAARAGDVAWIDTGLKSAQQSLDLFQTRVDRGWVDLEAEGAYSDALRSIIDELMRLRETIQQSP